MKNTRMRQHSRLDRHTHEDCLAEEIFVDDVRGGVLEAERVKPARREEVPWCRGMGVWAPVFGKDMKKEPQQCPYIGLTLTRPIYRSRLVVREIKKAMKKSDALSAAELCNGMPPLESVCTSLSVRLPQSGRGERQSELLQCTTSAVRTSMGYQCDEYLWSSLTRRRKGSHERTGLIWNTSAR